MDIEPKDNLVNSVQKIYDPDKSIVDIYPAVEKKDLENPTAKMWIQEKKSLSKTYQNLRYNSLR